MSGETRDNTVDIVYRCECGNTHVFPSIPRSRLVVPGTFTPDCSEGATRSLRSTSGT